MPAQVSPKFETIWANGHLASPLGVGLGGQHALRYGPGVARLGSGLSPVGETRG